PGGMPSWPRVRAERRAWSAPSSSSHPLRSGGPDPNWTTGQGQNWTLPGGRLPPSVNGMSTLTATQTPNAGHPSTPASLSPDGPRGARRTAEFAPATQRPRLVTRALLLRFVSAIGSATSFYLLLSVVPLFAKAGGGRGGGGGGGGPGAAPVGAAGGGGGARRGG